MVDFSSTADNMKDKFGGLGGKSVDELRDMATQRGIPGADSMDRDQLISQLTQ